MEVTPTPSRAGHFTFATHVFVPLPPTTQRESGTRALLFKASEEGKTDTPHLCITMAADVFRLDVTVLLANATTVSLSSPPIRAGVSTHVALVADDARVRLYVDGVVCCDVTTNCNVAPHVRTPLLLGKLPAAFKQGDRALEGADTILDMPFYSPTALQPADIRAVAAVPCLCRRIARRSSRHHR